MKKKILVLFSAMFVFALFGAVFALSGATNTGAEKSATTSCPMHKQNRAAVASSDNQKDSCCATADCCKDGKCAMGEDYCKNKDSCPMKKNADKQTAQTMDTSKITVVSSGGDDCCQRGADCCKGGACCHKRARLKLA